MKKEDFNLEVNDGTLTLSGKRKAEPLSDGVAYHRAERLTGRFSRSFYLPQSVRQDGIKANYRDGILEIHAPERSKPSRAKLRLRSIKSPPAGISHQRGSQRFPLAF